MFSSLAQVSEAPIPSREAGRDKEHQRTRMWLSKLNNFDGFSWFMIDYDCLSWFINVNHHFPY
jgi:hypothetical protein